jgi:predicted MFS family arabinose efflux permease
MISLAASGIGYLVLGAVDSLAAIACLAFVTAVLGDAFRPANIAAFTSLCAGETQARGFALMRLALNLGFSFGPAVGGILAAHSYRALFWIDGLTSLLAAAVLWAVVDDPDAHRVSAPKPKQAVSPWKDVPFLRFLGFLFLVGIVFFQLFGAWPLYLRQVRGFSERGIGFLLSLNAVLIVLFELPLIHRLERRNPLSVMTIGVAFMSAGFALLPAAGGYGFVLFTVLLWTIGEMLIFPLSATWIAGRACAANSGTTMGLFTLAFSLALCISPSAGALTYNRFGPSALWIGAGGLGFLVCAGLWRFNRSMHRERHENVSAEEAFAEPNLAEA